MLLGLAIGDALGNTSESMNPGDRYARHGWIDITCPTTMHGARRWIAVRRLTVGVLDRRAPVAARQLDPQRLGKLFAQPERQIFGGGQATALALANIRHGRPWTGSGSPRASNGALMRIAPVLLPHLKNPTPALWTDTLAAAHVTDDDELSNSSCLAFVDLLWRLIGMKAAPAAQWWVGQWTEVDEHIGCGKRYAARAGHPPGFEGTIGDLLRGLCPARAGQGP